MMDKLKEILSKGFYVKDFIKYPNHQVTFEELIYLMSDYDNQYDIGYDDGYDEGSFCTNDYDKGYDNGWRDALKEETNNG